MSEPQKVHAVIAQLPVELRELVRAELAAGNSIVDVSRASGEHATSLRVHLAKRVTTRPRASTRAILHIGRERVRQPSEFRSRDGGYSVVEPPISPAQEVDMDAIGAEVREAERMADEQRVRETFWRMAHGWHPSRLQATPPMREASSCIGGGFV